jgi:hypothetical protein
MAAIYKFDDVKVGNLDLNQLNGYMSNIGRVLPLLNPFAGQGQGKASEAQSD